MTTTDELGRNTSFTYDDLDRLITTALPDAKTTSQTYDAENERTSSTDPVGLATTYQYEGAGRLTVTTHPDGTSSITTYDAAGRSTATTDEAGYTSTTGYDADGRESEGKFVLIVGDKVLGVFDTQFEAIDEGWKQFPDRAILTKKITPTEEVVFIPRRVAG